MQNQQDIRWKQRFENYRKALEQLENAVQITVRYPNDPDINLKNKEDSGIYHLIKQGLIQSFEFTHELAWKVMKDYAEYQGHTNIHGSRDAARKAFSTGLIKNGAVWMEMIRSRNQTSHTYDEETSNAIVKKIIEEYGSALSAFGIKMEEIINAE